MDVKTACHQLVSLLCLLLIGDLVEGSLRPKPKFKKLCTGYGIDILSQSGVKIEPYSTSRVEMALVSHAYPFKRPQFKLKFEFKTNDPNGVLFYGRSDGHPNDLIAMILHQGDLMYKIKCPSAHADILIPARNNARLNDGQWHNVSYRVKFRRSYGYKGFVQIDGFSDSKQYDVSCENMTSIVMGGYSPSDAGYVTELENLPGHFNGCIRNVHPPTALRAPPKHYGVSICDN